MATLLVPPCSGPARSPALPSVPSAPHLQGSLKEGTVIALPHGSPAAPGQLTHGLQRRAGTGHRYGTWLRFPRPWGQRGSKQGSGSVAWEGRGSGSALGGLKQEQGATPVSSADLTARNRSTELPSVSVSPSSPAHVLLPDRGQDPPALPHPTTQKTGSIVALGGGQRGEQWCNAINI